MDEGELMGRRGTAEVVAGWASAEDSVAIIRQDAGVARLLTKHCWLLFFQCLTCLVHIVA